jgi:hypothetical protein
MPSGLLVEHGCAKDGIARECYLPVRFNGYTENIKSRPGKACEAVESLSFTFNTDIFQPMGSNTRRSNGNRVRILPDPPGFYFRQPGFATVSGRHAAGPYLDGHHPVLGNQGGCPMVFQTHPFYS